MFCASLPVTNLQNRTRSNTIVKKNQTQNASPTVLSLYDACDGWVISPVDCAVPSGREMTQLSPATYRDLVMNRLWGLSPLIEGDTHTR